MVYAVVLAPGASSRYGTSPPKQLELLPRVLDAVARRALDGSSSLRGAPARVESVQCPDWQRGPGASLRCGLAALPAEAEAAVVVLADGPELDPRAIDRVVEAWRDERRRRRRRLVRRRAPSPRAARARRLGRVPDEGARELEARLVPCDDLTPPGDVDVRR